MMPLIGIMLTEVRIKTPSYDVDITSAVRMERNVSATNRTFPHGAITNKQDRKMDLASSTSVKTDSNLISKNLLDTLMFTVWCTF
jgi:hypothetical protein